MKKGMKGFYYYLGSILLLLVINKAVIATQPRITPGLLSPEILELFAYEYPPLASIEISSSGLYPEIIQAALNKENIKATITILPIKSLVNYYLLQDNAVAIIGNGWEFTEEERKQLIIIPFYILNGGYYYYGPAHKQELTLDGNLSNLKGYTYGAQKGDDVSAFEESGISISFGNILTLYKKLKDRKIDFLSAPGLSKEWVVSQYLSSEKNNYLFVKGSSWEVSSSIIFNKQNNKAEAVARMFSRGLKKIKQDGTYFNILEKYHGKGNIPEDLFLRLERYQKESASLNRWSQ
jgi:polar amino acid transport system substrate-binding protein